MGSGQTVIRNKVKINKAVSGKQRGFYRATLVVLINSVEGGKPEPSAFLGSFNLFGFTSFSTASEFELAAAFRLMGSLITALFCIIRF